MIKTIIFDLGGVLIDWSPDYVFKTIFDDEKEKQYFFDNVCTPHWNELQDAGRPIAEANELLIKEFPQYEEQILAFYGRWEEMLGGPIQGTVEILKELIDNKKHRVLALTNWSAETFPIALGLYDFLHWFEGTLVSGVEKLKKPDPVFYQLMLDRYDIDPITALFIDDNLRNVEASNDFGLPAIRFLSPEGLRADLLDLGVL